jgi:hypothetical protein
MKLDWKGAVIVGVAVTVVSMLAGQYIAPLFGSFVMGGTAAVAVLLLNIANVKY